MAELPKDRIDEIPVKLPQVSGALKRPYIIAHPDDVKRLRQHYREKNIAVDVISDRRVAPMPVFSADIQVTQPLPVMKNA